MTAQNKPADTVALRRLSDRQDKGIDAALVRLAALEIEDLRRERMSLRHILNRLLLVVQSADPPFCADADAGEVFDLLVDDVRAEIHGIHLD